MYAEPVRVRQDGAWVAVDSSLHTNPDGTLSPKASVTDMRFSGGGTGPLFTVVRGGVSVAVSWPHALPKPSLNGDTAIYPDVYGATTWKSFDDKMNWKPGVQSKLADPNQRVLFNLDGVDVWQGVTRASSGRGGATDWELLQIRSNSYPNLEFWQGGQRVGNPFQ